MLNFHDIDEQQIIDNAVRELIMEHLSWSGSERRRPGDDESNVFSTVFNMYREVCFTPWEWADLETCDELDFRNYVAQRACEVADLADQKWSAAMELLGV